MRRRSPGRKFSIAAEDVEWLLQKLDAGSRHLAHEFPRDPEMLLKTPFRVRFERVKGLTRRQVREHMAAKYPDVQLPNDLGGDLDAPLQGFLIASARTFIFVCSEVDGSRLHRSTGRTGCAMATANRRSSSRRRFWT